jgi:hypothetical protein
MGLAKEQAWNYAIGIVQIDGIKPSDDFMELVEQEKRGELTSEKIREVLVKKYTIKENNDTAGEANA